MKKVLILLTVIFSLSLFADECFKAKGKVFKDAQHLRKTALSLGWHVYKPISIGAGALIKAKVKLYPEDDVNVCLRKTEAGRVEIRVQSASADAGVANWNVLLGKPEDSKKEDN
jgi:hypothetical protein